MDSFAVALKVIENAMTYFLDMVKGILLNSFQVGLKHCHYEFSRRYNRYEGKWEKGCL